MHQEIAIWLENNLMGDDVHNALFLLATHWSKAIDMDSPNLECVRKAISLYEMAGDDAHTKLYSLQDADKCFKSALDLVVLLPLEERGDAELYLLSIYAPVCRALHGVTSPVSSEIAAKLEDLSEHHVVPSKLLFSFHASRFLLKLSPKTCSSLVRVCDQQKRYSRSD